MRASALVHVAALMTALDRRAWWLPAWLDRTLPDVDLEGAKLDRAERYPSGHGAVRLPGETAPHS